MWYNTGIRLENEYSKKKGRRYMKILFCSGFSLFGTGSGTLIRTQTESFLDQGDEVAII